ncbi:uncharacterized protein LOC121993232 isoform X1 [Zingiber officinale]|uniref:uncharacterized protein LOC121993232 isoform X1 n=2 Tax=Zingiber officinale TaxID=94328 RepID=UPI001C4D96E0|nr:uncharacterized protein LOC121993232 isoform X1 [Zingiber officinale]
MERFASRMEDHLVLYVDRLMLLGKNGTMPADEENSAADEGDQLLQMAECRICQEEGLSKDFEIPCACSGSLKYAHRTCVQHWCNEKGDITCEICNEQYTPGYSTLPSAQCTVDASGGLTISGSHLDLHDPWFLATTAAHRHSLETEYDEYDSAEVSGPVLCRSVVLMLLTLLLLRQAFSISVVVEFDDGDDDDDVSTYFSIFLLRAIVFLLPCYIMAWAISILQRRWRRKEAAALAANEAALILQQSAL